VNSSLNLPKPFFVLAPMDDVTDTVFRQVIASCAPPDLFFTEFVNVDGLQSRGRPKLINRLAYTEPEQPLIAQIWGRTPANYEKTASELVDMGYKGIDINMGCPQKRVIKNSCCAALVNNRDMAVAFIEAVKRGVNGRVPVSVKLRLGWDSVDFSWPELILQQNIDMLTVHGRTRNEMSKVPAHWDDIAKVREIRDKIAPNTLIVGNGDVLSRAQGEQLAMQHKLDGIMIGRGIFTDPYIFSKKSPWKNMKEAEKLELYIKHIELFVKTYQNRERNWESLKRMAKVYVHGIDNASTFRDQLMRSQSADEMLSTLKKQLKSN
jgi:tRNA-dihydrouridine synthase